MAGFDFGSNASISNAIADLPTSIVLKVFKSSNADLSSPTQVGEKWRCEGSKFARCPARKFKW